MLSMASTPELGFPVNAPELVAASADLAGSSCFEILRSTIQQGQQGLLSLHQLWAFVNILFWQAY